MQFERRDFLKFSGLGMAAGGTAFGSPSPVDRASLPGRAFNAEYRGPYLNRVAFPMGGMGAGMICLEGTGAFSHVSLRHRPDVFNEPCTFAAVSVKGPVPETRVLEGPVPEWKVFGLRNTGNGAPGSSFGLPRLSEAEFSARFPFATVRLKEPGLPLDVELTGWSPFTPSDPDNSSLPVCAVEYRFQNNSDTELELVFSYNAVNFMRIGDEGNYIRAIKGGFVLGQKGGEAEPSREGEFAAFVMDESVIVDHCWFRGGWWDSLTMAWKNLSEERLKAVDPVDGPAPGASLYVPFRLAPGQHRTIRLLMAWYVPKTELRFGEDPDGAPAPVECEGDSCCSGRKYHVPWYASRFRSLDEAASYWRKYYRDLQDRSRVFSDCLFDTNLPPEVMEAVSANLTILKSPTVLRQCDGRLWCFEGCSDGSGCCHGSCTHVWNYAQAIPHLFPSLERSLRETEFQVSQAESGHQTFRSSLPIRQVAHSFHAAADGQLGGIMKVHRDWRISGDLEWLRGLWPEVRRSLEYCIRTWDPKRKGVVEEPHHNTYDIEFWGPDGMCTSFYLGALSAAVAMGEALGDDVGTFREVLKSGREYLESRLFNGDYYQQEIRWKDLEARDPVELSKGSWSSDYSPEAVELLNREGPKYQYGTGCLSDGILGSWIARVCGLPEVANVGQVVSTLRSIHKYNLKHDLSGHTNPQRPSYAVGHEGGLLLCTWPKGGRLSLPFVYSNEVWTGIEYQVASHLMLHGLVEEGVEIVRTCRERYDGTIRNPFNEYECGHWYARALSSYGLLQGLTGARYDAVEKVLYIDSQIGDFRAFLAVEGAFGTVGMEDGKPFVNWKWGQAEVRRIQLEVAQASSL